MDKKHLQWGAIVAIVLFIITQTFLFGMWKGTTDARFEIVNANIDKVDDKIELLRLSGTKIALEDSEKLDDVIFNQKLMMKKLGMKWEKFRNGDK